MSTIATDGLHSRVFAGGDITTKVLSTLQAHSKVTRFQVQ